MWRFLNSIPRVFRSHVHSPRPSAGRYVEDDQESVDLNEKTGCPFTGRRRNSQDAGETRCCSAKVLNSLLRKDDNHNHETGCSLLTRHNANFGSEEGKDRWRSCRFNFWNLFQGSHPMLEAISWGSAVLWGQDTEKRKRRTRLLYRILFTVPGSNKTIRAIKDGTDISRLADPHAVGQMAIKDAAGAAQDAAINISKAETLDSALEEFQSMCTEYEARNESLLGLEAAQHGDFASAVDHLRSSCMLGNMSACYNLGLCYETGSGVLQNSDKAKHYYKMAATAGHSMALYNLGLMYMKCAQADTEENSTGAADTNCTCGCSKAEGLTLLEKAAKLGLPQAQTYLGIHHIEESQDVARAVPYFRAAAEQNDVEGQYFLAICYEQGWGVDVNECRAAQLYSLAASAGHEAALYNLAVFNENGLGGLPEDQAAAIELYQKAADLGHEQALHKLEEIKAAKASEDKRREQAENFHHLHHQHHKDEGLSHYHSHEHYHQSTSLSPSASSPDLTEYLYKGMSFFFGSHPAQISWDKGHMRPLDPGGHNRTILSHKRGLLFQLGGSEESDDYEDEQDSLSPTSPRSKADESFDSITEEEISHPLRSIHRSNTYPNFSMVACNI